MRHFRVINLEQFQHYKDRNPPWIKLHNTLTDHYEFGCLQDASKLHLLMIWLLASRHNNRLPYDPKWIAARIQATVKVDLDCLITYGFIEIITVCEQCASKSLANCEHLALLDRDRGETEDIKKRRGREATPRASRLPDEQWLAQLKANPAFQGIDIDREIAKCQAWCSARGKTAPPSRQRIVNWLNGADQFTGNGKPAQSVFDTWRPPEVRAKEEKI